jgi:hypothetical protein
MKLIKTCEQVYKLADNKKCIFVKFINKHLPAAIAISWQARYLINLIKQKQIYVYKKKKLF